MQLLTVKAASESLGLSAALVYALCQQRKIRHERHGLGRGTIRIPAEALDEYRRSVTVELAAALPAGPKKFKHLKV